MFSRGPDNERALCLSRKTKHVEKIDAQPAETNPIGQAQPNNKTNNNKNDKNKAVPLSDLDLSGQMYLLLCVI